MQDRGWGGEGDLYVNPSKGIFEAAFREKLLCKVELKQIAEPVTS